ncbi:hypothetical protein ACA910_008078 [Epithemia clementina (nom. ined.)]
MKQSNTPDCCSFFASCNSLDFITVNGCNAGAAPAAKIDPKDIADVTSCGTLKLIFADSTSGGVCETTGLIITRMYTITDISTNDFKTCPPQRIAIKDTEKPTFALKPADTTLECDTDCAKTLDPTACTGGSATATDNCNAIIPSKND